MLSGFDMVVCARVTVVVDSVIMVGSGVPVVAGSARYYGRFR